MVIFIPSFLKVVDIPKSNNSLILWTTMTHFCFEKLLNKNGYLHNSLYMVKTR